MIPQGGFPPPQAVVFIICNMCIHAGAKCTIQYNSMFRTCLVFLHRDRVLSAGSNENFHGNR